MDGAVPRKLRGMHTIATPTARTNGRFVHQLKTHGTHAAAHVESGMRYQIVPHRPLQSATLESTEVVRHVVDHGIRYGSPTEHAG